MVNIDRDKLIGHINNLEDKEEIKRVIDKVEIVLNRYLITSTDFLNPHELNLAISVLNRFKNEVFLKLMVAIMVLKTVSFIFILIMN